MLCISRSKKCRCVVAFTTPYSRTGRTALIGTCYGWNYCLGRRSNRLPGNSPKKSTRKNYREYIAPDLQTWTKTFPDEFYERIYALRGWDFPEGVKRPAVIGKYTNTYVYERLPEGVLEKLRAVNPTENGRRKFKHHQWLTRNVGYRELRDQVRGVVLLLRISNNWTISSVILFEHME